MSYTNPAAYERFMGRWSARLAPEFLRFAQVKGGRHLLDVGCGTGVLGRAIASSGAAVKITGVDPSPDYLAFAARGVASDRVRFEVGYAEALPFADATFDAALALLVLQDFDEPARAVREMARVTRRDGIVTACIWDFEHGLPMLSLLGHAAEAVAPNEALGRSLKQHAGLQDLNTLWQECGLQGILTETFEIDMAFSSFEDYWQPVLGRSTPTSAFVARVNEETGGALARVLRGKISHMEPDGSFVLPARAFAVRGIVSN
jgi:ubiquinone/menaquinone biosynthesis C-methylase UbiE